MSLASPIRHPETGSAAVMTRRGWVLVVANLLLPGTAQIAAGSRRLGRFGLRATGLMWALLIALAVVAVLNKGLLLSLFTQAGPMLVLQLLLAAYAVLWVILTFDTLRLVKLVKTAAAARFGIAFFTVAALVLSAGTAGYGSYLIGAARGAFGSIFGSGPSQPPVDGRYNVMLLGGDAGADRQGLRPDSMSVVSVDAKTGQAVNIGLPRNLDPVPFPADSPLHQLYPNGYGYNDTCDVDVCMLNSIYTEVSLYKRDLYPQAKTAEEAGVLAMRDALEGVTGLKIQYYVLIDMQGFVDLINQLGGIDIDVKEKLPIGGDENLNGVKEWIMPGKQHMTGYKAIWYVRSRHSTSDYDRMARQRQVEDAILKQMNPANVLARFQGIAGSGKRIMKTDIPQSMLGYFVSLALKTKTQPVKSLDLVPPTIDPENPDFPHIRALVKKATHPASATPATK